MNTYPDLLPAGEQRGDRNEPGHRILGRLTAEVLWPLLRSIGRVSYSLYLRLSGVMMKLARAKMCQRPFPPHLHLPQSDSNRSPKVWIASPNTS